MMPAAAFVVTVLTLGLSPLAAQELQFDPLPLDTCLAAQDGVGQSGQCIGRAASICMEQPLGHTTPGMAFCLGEEYDLWDAKLNEAYVSLRADYKQQDVERFEGAPSLADALRDLQRGWISFRDGRCAFETAQWYGGTGASPAFLSCMLQLTADQTIYLWSVAEAKS